MTSEAILGAFSGTTSMRPLIAVRPANQKDHPPCGEIGGRSDLQ